MVTKRPAKKAAKKRARKARADEPLSDDTAETSAKKTPKKKATKSPAKTTKKAAKKKSKAAAKKTRKKPAKRKTKAAKGSSAEVAPQAVEGASSPTDEAEATPPAPGRPTEPARPRAKRALRKKRVGAPPEAVERAAGPVPASAPSPVPRTPPVPIASTRSSRPPEPAPASTAAGGHAAPGRKAEPPRRSYLEKTPRDHTDLVAGLVQVARGAAKDLRTLISHAIAMSHHKDDRSDR